MQLSARYVVALLLLAPIGGPTWSAVLPEDRADLMYHHYDGGGTEVTGPALLVRKAFAEQISFNVGHYTDSISGASVDVVTTASPYKEKRDEQTVGVDFLRRNTTTSLMYVKSDERDYVANTLGINIAHEMFDGLTTLSVGYLVGRDQVGKSGTTFEEDINRYHYKLGWSQVFTRSFLINLEYEGIVEEGYLNSPYRAARVLGLLVPEVYPGTRNSYAIALRAVKGISGDEGELGASLHLGYRYFWDTWDINAHTLEVGYQKRLGARWVLESRYRYYQQQAASFYSDNFSTAMTFMARDKELSTFKSHALGIKAGYLLFERGAMLQRSTINLAYDRLRFIYDDFTDVRSGEPFEFDANIVQIFVSAWF